MTTTVEPTQVPAIARMLDDYLWAKRELEGQREIAGGKLWRASLLHNCLRRQYLELHLGQPRLLEDTALSLRRFEIGHTWSDRFKQWFSEMGVLIGDEISLTDDELNVGAHGDYMIGADDWSCGIELKSMQSGWFWHRTKSATTTATDEHMIQAGCYDLLCRRQGIEIPWMVVCVSKDDLTISQDLVLPRHRDDALRRLTLLNQAAATGTPPPCTCQDPQGEYNGRAWRWCPYYAGSPESREGKKPVPDGPCCEEA